MTGAVKWIAFLVAAGLLFFACFDLLSVHGVVDAAFELHPISMLIAGGAVAAGVLAFFAVCTRVATDGRQGVRLLGFGYLAITASISSLMFALFQ